MSIPQEGNPPILSFEEIDELCMQQLLIIEEKSRGMPLVVSLDKTQCILLGTIKEILRTLDSLHPKEKKVLVS